MSSNTGKQTVKHDLAGKRDTLLPETVLFYSCLARVILSLFQKNKYYGEMQKRKDEVSEVYYCLYIRQYKLFKINTQPINLNLVLRSRFQT